MILNQTPIRTSKNFGTNNIKIDNLDIPKEIEEFKGLTIKNENQEVEILSMPSKEPLKYGVSKEFEEQIYAKSNQNIKIIINSKCDKNIYLDFIFNEENINLVDNIEIIANQETNSTLIIRYQGLENNKYFHNGILRVVANKNAKVNIVLLNLLNTNSNNFQSIENTLDEKAQIKYTVVDFGGLNSITNYYANVKGNSANSMIDTIYLGAENQLFDLNYIVELYGEKSKANIEVQGALKDQSKKKFKGTIDLKKGCKKAKGNENEYCMLLSEKAKSTALPMLLCTEEDVEGNHSTATGKPDPRELFYIMSRGFSTKDAKKLMVKAKFNSILQNIPNQEIKKEILEQIEHKLD